MQTEKSQPLGQQVMLETCWTSFLALSIYHQVRISQSASETIYLPSFCLACEAEARHMYCFSGGVVVVVVVVVGVGVGGVNFLVFRSFSRKL